jgi:hypothetical protein
MHPYKSFKILTFVRLGWQLDGLTAKANRLPWPVRTEQAGSSRLAVPFRYVPCSKLPDGASGRFGSGADAPPAGTRVGNWKQRRMNCPICLAPCCQTKPLRIRQQYWPVMDPGHGPIPGRDREPYPSGPQQVLDKTFNRSQSKMQSDGSSSRTSVTRVYLDQTQPWVRLDGCPCSTILYLPAVDGDEKGFQPVGISKTTKPEARITGAPYGSSPSLRSGASGVGPPEWASGNGLLRDGANQSPN